MSLAETVMVIAVANRRHRDVRQWPPDSERAQLFKLVGNRERQAPKALPDTVQGMPDAQLDRPLWLIAG